MARVHKDFAHSYPTLSVSELQKPILFVIDMVNGFVKEGALHDEGINAISENIIALVKNNEHRSVFVCDRHVEGTREFLSYPTHCVIGSTETEVIEELQPYVYEVMYKNSTNTFTCLEFQEFLETRIFDHQDIVITGCCSDICILQFALSLNAWLNEHNEEDKRVIVPINCIDTYHIDGVHDAVEINEFSIRNMAANGIYVVEQITE